MTDSFGGNFGHFAFSMDGLEVIFTKSVVPQMGEGYVTFRATRPNTTALFGTPVVLPEFPRYDGQGFFPSFLSPDRCRLYAMRGAGAGQPSKVLMATRGK